MPALLCFSFIFYFYFNFLLEAPLSTSRFSLARLSIPDLEITSDDVDRVSPLRDAYRFISADAANDVVRRDEAAGVRYCCTAPVPKADRYVRGMDSALPGLMMLQVDRTAVIG
ncbi:hypothetical protein BDW68DRAFT_170299 [Aspergillus falconensis]